MGLPNSSTNTNSLVFLSSAASGLAYSTTHRLPAEVERCCGLLPSTPFQSEDTCFELTSCCFTASAFWVACASEIGSETPWLWPAPCLLYTSPSPRDGL